MCAAEARFLRLRRPLLVSPRSGLEACGVRVSASLRPSACRQAASWTSVARSSRSSSGASARTRRMACRSASSRATMRAPRSRVRCKCSAWVSSSADQSRSMSSTTAVSCTGIPASHIRRSSMSRSVNSRGAGAMGSRSRSAVRSGRLSCSARGSRPRHEPIPRRHGRSTPYRDRRVQGDRHAALVSARSAAADVRGLRMNTAVQAGFRCCRTLRDGLTRRVATARPRPRERTAS